MFWNCPEILLIWSECPEIDLCYAVVTALPLFCTLCLFNWTLSVLLAHLLTTISPYVHYSFMCNIALVTFFGLQYWSASMNSIYERIKMSFFCVLSLVKPTKMSWNLLKIGSWNFPSCCCECMIDGLGVPSTWLSRLNRCIYVVYTHIRYIRHWQLVLKYFRY